MLVKKEIVKKISLLLLSLSLCIVPINVFAYDGELTSVIDESEDVTTFENEATYEDKEYINLRNKLIDKYGADKAYSLLGFVPVEKQMIDITDNSINNLNVPSQLSISPLAVDDVITTFTKNKSVTKGTMKVTMYKNHTRNIMDIWCEMTYASGKSAGVQGLLTKYPDSIGVSYDYTQVSKVSTSYSSCISDYSDSVGGGSGSIDYGSTYARIVYTVKPTNSSTKIANCHGNTIMLYAQRTSAVKDNISISIGCGSISAGSGSHFTPNYLEYAGW